MVLTPVNTVGLPSFKIVGPFTSYTPLAFATPNNSTCSPTPRINERREILIYVINGTNIKVDFTDLGSFGSGSGIDWVQVRAAIA